MRRLLALAKKVLPLTPEKEAELSRRLQKLTLQPGETIPFDTPPKSWIFVEEGFLMLMQCNNRSWRCTNFYYEGVSTVFYNVGAAELAEGSLQVQATELSTLYYLTPTEDDLLLATMPEFRIVRTTLNMRSFAQSQARCTLLDAKESDRLNLLQGHFPFLLRAPADRLSEWLRLKDKRQQMEVLAAKRRYAAKKSGS